MNYQNKHEKPIDSRELFSEIIESKINLEKSIHNNLEKSEIDNYRLKYGNNWEMLKSDSVKHYLELNIIELNCSSDSLVYQLCYSDLLNSYIPKCYIANCYERVQFLKNLLKIDSRELLLMPY